VLQVRNIGLPVSWCVKSSNNVMTFTYRRRYWVCWV